MFRIILVLSCFAWLSEAFILYDFMEAATRRSSPQKNQRKRSAEKGQYDFVIVGSSPAGCVLANRLSENPNWKILLIEAGKPENFFNKVPLIATYLHSTDYNWGYLAEPQNTSCWGMKDQRCSLPRGKGLGGSSVINYMMYIRGNKLDFDRWEEAGNTGWSYKDVLPYFKKSERSRLKGMENSPYHSGNGMLNVEYPAYRTKLANAFVVGSQQTGYNVVDYNGESQLGVSYLQANTQNGQRHSAYSAFIEPILSQRPNLRVLSETKATKVLIDPSTKHAYGVEYVRNRKKYTVFAKKEVILSAGVFNSAQLLMLSGIGPRDHLEEINIPLIVDLPVGETLYDHVNFPGPTFITNSSGISLNYERLMNFNTLAEYFNGKGPLTIPGTLEALSFVRTKYAESNGLPDVEMMFSTGGLASDRGGLKTSTRIRDDIYNSVFKPLETIKNDHWNSYIMLFHPKSKGYMRLRDNNPFSYPKIYTNYLKEQEDVEKILEGVKEAIRVANSPALQKYNSRLHNIPLPNCKQYTFGTDDYWRCAIRTMTGTIFHQTSTCKMGPVSDPTSVVSPSLLVHGIHNLRVVDVSIIPYATTGHTAAPAYMIGEKAADLIKAHWL